jgi:hypothetical protein
VLLPVRLPCMRRFGWLLLLTLAASACSATPALAQVKASDAAATHAYLEAKITWRRAEAADQAVGLKAITALAAHVDSECPDVLVGAPNAEGEKTNQSGYEISEEIFSAGVGAAEYVTHAQDARFAKTVGHLRWSNSGLTRLLRSLALEQAEQSAIAPPNLCADMKFWVASGYTSTSDATKQLLHRHQVVSSITVITSEPNEPVADTFNLNALVARRLKPYEDHPDKQLARHALGTPTTINTTALKHFFEAIGSISVALGLPATPPPSRPNPGPPAIVPLPKT